MAVRLDQLLAAFARAVVDAQHEVQRSKLGDLSQFFKANGSPVTVDLKLPRTSPDSGEQEPVVVRVPLAILVGHAGMSIRETQVSMQVEVSPIADTARGRKAAASRGSASSEPYQWKPPANLPVISVSTVTSGKTGDVGVAQLTLRVAADDVPEGLARLLDHLNKTL